jgi:hypothetical protein
VGSQWIKVSGEKAIEGLKNNNAFIKVDVATNDETLSQDTLLRAASRLLSVTGQNILPMPQNVSRGVQELVRRPRFASSYRGFVIKCGTESGRGRSSACAAFIVAPDV